MSACGPLPGTGVVPAPIPQGFPMDEVKVIAPDLRQNDDPGSLMLQKVELSPNRRLLFRYSGLRNHMSHVMTWDGKKIEVMIGVDTTQALPAQTEPLLLCPLNRNWMLRATWSRAHPFGHQGEWAKSGGDFDPAACIKVGRVDQNKLYFDVTTWFENGLKGLGKNFGFVLCSTTPVTVLGNLSPNLPPRIEWVEQSRN